VGDKTYKEFCRRMSIEYVSGAEIIRKRRQNARCIFCARSIGGNTNNCPCISSYIYEDESGGKRLRRNESTTLPCGIVTGINAEGLAVLFMGGGKKGKEGVVSIEDIVDLEEVVRNGVDIEEDEKRGFRNYQDSLAVAAANTI